MLGRVGQNDLRLGQISGRFWPDSSLMTRAFLIWSKLQIFLQLNWLFFGTEKWLLQIKVNFTIWRSAILIQSKKPWSYDFHLSHFTCTTINILEFMIGSTLFNHFFEIIIPMMGDIEPVFLVLRVWLLLVWELQVTK